MTGESQTGQLTFTRQPVPETDKPLPAQVRIAMQRYWGFTQLRFPQADVIRALLARQDALVILPTGFGKSLCFQLSAILQAGTTLVISPLIALMEDQASGLRQRGVMAEALHGQLTRHHKRRILSHFERGNLSLLYLSPEMLFNLSVWQRLQQSPVEINGLIVDEAHTVAEWGTSFRPAYMRLGAIRRGLRRQFPIAAFTATANPDRQAVLQDVLELRNPLAIRASPRRANIRILVSVAWTIAGRRKQLIGFVQRHQVSTGLIYARTRESCRELVEILKAKGLLAAAYHGGIGPAERRRLEREWLAGDRRFLVCTNAFGMGIDCPHVRWVVHYQPPATVTDYVQEIGRAGRDGKPANTLLLVSEPTGLLDSSDRQLGQYLQRQIEADYRQARQLLPQLPNEGNYETVAQQFPASALSLAILRRAGCIRWDNPFRFTRRNSSLSTHASRPNKKGYIHQDCTSIQYFISSQNCRWQTIETALGYPSGQTCQACDNCIRATNRTR